MANQTMQSIAEDSKPSLDPLNHGSDRRVAVSASAHRSISASSRSSTSSDILVASGPPAPSTNAVQPPMDTPVLPPSPVQTMPVPSARAEIRNGHILVITVSSTRGIDLLLNLHALSIDYSTINQTWGWPDHPGFDGLPKADAQLKDEFSEKDIYGPNARGTYSKQYTLLHPGIEWVHRGQGRYLPKTHLQAETLNRSSSASKASEYSLRKATDDRMSLARSPSVLQRRRSLDDDNKHSIFATPRPRVSLRRQFSESQNLPTVDQRSARSSRRGHAVPTTEFERRSSRNLMHQNYTEEDDYDSMADDKEATFAKEYVDAHPGEKFYHTGNGWYKKGDRPKGRRLAKQREGDQPVGFRRTDGSWQFEPNATIHVSALDQYPGVEFHHAGNGWYKPGPDAKGRRSSLVVDYDEGDSEDGDNDGDEDDDLDGLDDVAVNKEYTLLHPEVEWVHRGNGRWKRKSTLSAPATQASVSHSPGVERDTTIYSKEYVLAHPEEEFHHRGNARYMRGPPPEHWASARRRRTQTTESVADDEEPQLFNKSYVDAHPEEQFHHRGQGRWARGPRPQQVIVAHDEEEDELSDNDPDALVDTDYVNMHPDETFHHRGQGRWARGLPPPGSSNKTAVRGPGIRDRSDAANLLEEEDEFNRPPPVTALVLRAEGPDQWPGLSWHYRGGGKWSRMTKTDFEDLQRGVSRRQKVKGYTNKSDGPEAQLEREAAEAARPTRRAGKDAGFVKAREVYEDGQDGPAAKRRRVNKHGSFQTQESLLSKESSNTHSQAPTPKPRMLEPGEDILAEDDLPMLYRDDEWSPAPDDIEDYGRHHPEDLFHPTTNPESFVRALTKYDPSVRSLDNIKRVAENTQRALDALQDEYLFLEKVTAPHARIPRKPARGGRVPVEEQIFEDKKEADLYDYAYDARRIGFQDPTAQKIQRDADGRELRGRRNRSGATTNNGTLPGWNFGDDEPLGPRRAVKPVSRFDGIVNEPRRRLGVRTNFGNANSKGPSMTPDRTTTPLGGPVPNGYIPATSGRWRGHVPKRIRELQGENVNTAPGQGREGSPGTARKGRPPGSKNLHRRRDAGIKKGPRRPKVAGDDFSMSEGDGEY